ncbi:uncharacterized protein LOC125896689 isoform X3 [Epinephelus fuscoguttatus]|uniref:uncharacterized protein LOC125896689 isoform X3 n=1 Tax=Epinephelus fuscoguttatus TaxID=293821 RepID=UPI0020D164E2|nr:uncharacterized protein LOC125896689 isoform X3 [Epinephelus fuscoguttatus]XP_049445415.1 uncharacterized protein LOC125896689 isoform X3 [Epinephelus fuscoguttatus]XP_049445416.1 uncharacterized protein LOC125896689 isoform X3 [Epinephelus fuscoguttatus]XP_049445417.1 uncharacterized protein LOC125896689 isoform X3 [Epinephelus fuscoguttatus]XP_049445418.1 uncharacterized protein LOC125896689 isoform X3 [Epinephelus fuscoguttatus]XP_049445419.1 uncharacterized protein LOC125896689 isoform 
MDTKLFLIFVLQFQAGISGTTTYLYYRAGDDATLPCATASPSDTTCSTFIWLYNCNQYQTFIEVQNGNVVKSSARAARLSVDTGCSLVINNVTAEDVGHYTCRQGRSTDHDAVVYLNVLTISPSPPDADPKRDGEVTLECSLLRYRSLGPCPQNSVRWVNETGAVLLGEGVGYKFLRQTECVSALTVKRQSGNNRKYTCQFVDNNKVEIEADYTPDFTESTGWSPLSYVMLALRIAGLILMIVITIHVIRIKWNTKPLDDDDSENNDGDVQYENDGARPATARLH